MKPLDNSKGQDYWRSLDQLADTPEFRRFVDREFPHGTPEENGGMDRRNFLTLMGASLAMAGLTACRNPVEKIVPYVSRPAGLSPGVPRQYATTMPLGLSAYGVLVTSNEGRPTKIEGNPLHPSTRGASNAIVQASILGLYDPDRARLVLKEGAEKSRDEFVVAWQEIAAKFAENGGEGLAVLSAPFSSPTMARLRDAFLAKYPNARWVAYEPVSNENVYEGLRLATGRVRRPVYNYDRAKVIVSLDSDFLQTESESITANIGFAKGRRVRSTSDEMNRLYVAESGYSLTGAMADHRLRLKSGDVGRLLLALAGALKRQAVSIVWDSPANPASEFDANWLAAAAADLQAQAGSSLVTAGRGQPVEIHTLVYAINAALGNVGQTVEYHEFIDALPSSMAELQKLTADMRAGSVDTLVMIGGNPVYNAPANLDFGGALRKVETTVRLSSHVDESSSRVTWHLPQSHYLEAWGDARAADGTTSVIQPLIEPLYEGFSDVELAGILVDGRSRAGYEIVRETWKTALPAVGFEKAWRRVLHDGLMDGSATEPAGPTVDRESLGSLVAGDAFQRSGGNDLEVAFVPSHSVHDGRFANNGWLQELPDTVSKITWDNAAQMSAATAEQHGVANGDMVRLTLDGRELELPAWIVPGHADGSVTVPLGYGRTAAGRVGNGVGFDAYALRPSSFAGFATGLTLVGTGRKHVLATTQDHGSMEGRPIVRGATLEEFRRNPAFAKEAVEHPPLKSLWQEHSYDEGSQWGMSIDLNTCTGCNACTIACQSENNIPVVGKKQVELGREMHWIRIDRYFTGDVIDPDVVVQPVACQHCENAPCEQVCPVAATVHTSDGLNSMVYNRCIGTRYCANNCPYKVRRFNFFNFTKETPEVMKMAMNPDVTVRFRGVMEKCTYCVQRIQRAGIAAKKDQRDVADGDIVTACQQACPAGAIVFGNINDPDSEVSRLRKQQQRYDLLAELNVQPRTSYLAKLHNPNPKLA